MQVDDPEDDTPIDFVVQPPNNFVRSLNNNLHTQLGVSIVLVLLTHCYQLYSIVLVINYCIINFRIVLFPFSYFVLLLVLIPLQWTQKIRRLCEHFGK